MRTWRAAMGAANELSEQTHIRHRVYKNYFPNNGWFVTRTENIEHGYYRIQEDVALKWKQVDEFLSRRADASQD